MHANCELVRFESSKLCSCICLCADTRIKVVSTNRKKFHSTCCFAPELTDYFAQVNAANRACAAVHHTQRYKKEARPYCDKQHIHVQELQTGNHCAFLVIIRSSRFTCFPLCYWAHLSSKCLLNKSSFSATCWSEMGKNILLQASLTSQLTCRLQIAALQQQELGQLEDGASQVLGGRTAAWSLNAAGLLPAHCGQCFFHCSHCRRWTSAERVQMLWCRAQQCPLECLRCCNCLQEVRWRC